MEKIKVSAPGKLILSGEHAVVYGYPAIVVAVNRRLSVDGKYQIESDIPIGCGVGSSAAYAVALAGMRMKLRNQEIDKERVNKSAYRMEKIQHGNPSGVDNTICTYGGFLWYRKEAEGLKVFSPIKIKKRLRNLFIINTGKPIESTREMVAYIARSYRKRRKRTETLLESIGELTKSFLRYLLAEEELPLANLISENEYLLERLGVVSSATRNLIRQIEKIGGAAKISGAGGRRDKSGVLLVYHDKPEKLMSFARKQKLDIFRVKLGEEGVRVDRES